MDGVLTHSRPSPDLSGEVAQQVGTIDPARSLLAQRTYIGTYFDLAFDDDDQMVIALTDELQAALAVADDARLREVAVPWSRTEEFGEQADPDDLAGVLTELAALAREATAADERLYCWTCL